MAEPEPEPPEDETPKPKARKAKKVVLPEAESPTLAEVPTPQEVKKARKADLTKWLEGFGLPTAGRVAELRTRLSDHLAAQRAPAGEEPGPTAAGEKGEGKAEEVKEKPEEAEAEEAEAEEVEKKPGGKAKHRPTIKPELDEALRRALALRRVAAAARPRFLRQEWFRYRRLGLKWRRPQGGQSKLRRHMGYRTNVVSIGFRSPRLSRGLHPSGFAEVLIHNVRQLEGLDAKRQAARVAHNVGFRKRVLIQREADKRGIRVLNPVEVEE